MNSVTKTITVAVFGGEILFRDVPGTAQPTLFAQYSNTVRVLGVKIEVRYRHWDTDEARLKLTGPSNKIDEVIGLIETREEKLGFPNDWD